MTSTYHFHEADSRWNHFELEDSEVSVFSISNRSKASNVEATGKLKSSEP